MVKVNTSYGVDNPLQEVFPRPIVAQRAPTSTDKNYPIGQVWVDKPSQVAYILTTVTSGAPVWSLAASGTGDLETLTGDSGTASPSSGNIQIAGGTNITTSGSGAIVTVGTDAAATFATSVSSASFDTTDAAAGVTITSSDIDADGTDADISITVTPKGTGDFVVDLGDIQNTSGDIIATHSSAGADVTLEATNSDNTDPASRAGVELAVGGTSAGDPYANFLISGGQTYSIGIDNSSTNDDFVLSNSAALGTSNVISIDGSSNDVSVLTNLALPTAATQLQMEGGAVTDFIGQATLVAGTVTVANTNIAAADKIFVQRESVNGSTALGILDVSISAATSFTITALQPGTPASTETNDISIVNYFIVRQL
jgi:hypothetical protein